MTLSDEFQDACLDAIEECKTLSYRPTAWIGMIRKPGGAAAAAQRLLVNGDIQSGFERLIRLGREDLTVEHAVLQPRWTELFSDAHRDAARWRLERARKTSAC